MAWTGAAARAPAADDRVDAAGRAVLPGFVDSHAHLVFAGNAVPSWTWSAARCWPRARRNRFCERGASSVDEAAAVLAAGVAAGLQRRVHANHLGPGPGVQLAVAADAASAAGAGHAPTKHSVEARTHGPAGRPGGGRQRGWPAR